MDDKISIYIYIRAIKCSKSPKTGRAPSGKLFNSPKTSKSPKKEKRKRKNGFHPS